MATVVITPEMQRANAEALLGKDPGKFRDPALRWTQNRYAEIRRLLLQAEAEKPVTILNLNPFPLKINGGVYFPDEVPACQPGQPYSIYVIRETRWGHKDLGCDGQNMMQMEPVPAIPLVLASEYIREYVQQDGGFGGVLCYVGDDDPATIPVHDPESKSKLGLVRVPEVAYSDRGEFYVEVRERNFHEMLGTVRRKRNSSILLRLQSANSWYENDSQRMNVNDTHRALARLALDEHLIPELPRWVMQANLPHLDTPDPCPSCAFIPKAGAMLCANCNHIYDVVKAFQNTRIAYGAVEMERLTAEEWVVVNEIQANRKAERAKGKTLTAARAQAQAQTSEQSE